MGVTKTILSFGTGPLVTNLGIELDAGYSGGSSGLSQLTVQGVHPSAPSTAIQVDGAATATLTNVKVTGFTNSGIANYGNLTASQSTITQNSSDQYGGGFVNDGQLAIHQSTISNNSTNADGGGILNLEDGIVNMAASTINGNSAISGGGIYSLGQLFMAYSTIAGNVAEGAAGGGINVAANSDGGPSGLNAYHVTITDNAAEFGNQCGTGGGVFIDQTTSGSVDFNASIIARNENINAQADDYVGPIHGESEIEDGANKDILGHFTPGCGSNFKTFVAMDGRNGQMVPILDFTASPSSLFGNNHLASNSGPTQTVALATNSPAIKASQNDAVNLGIYNAVDPGGMSTTQDQRGSAAPSPKGTHYDLGAYEHN